MAAIIFDFDGTLGDTLRGILATSQETLRRMGFPPADEAALVATIGLPLRFNFTRGAGLSEEEADQAVILYRAIFDEVAVPLGQFRLKASGSNGGHNGLGHIQQLIGQNYARLRMGIGNDFPQGMQIQHVLGHFTPEERELLQPAIDIAVDVIRSFVLAGIDITMNQYNKLGKQCKKPLESTNGSGQPASSKHEA